MKYLAMFIIRFYQVMISPHKKSCCRYHPSCSAYAFEAINKYGLIKGGILAYKRFKRCNYLYPGGDDPVP
ncbi:MAG: membrane protein insertion efficiency factor YidD [Anaerolineae bacterium]|nr:membrane protein insertion efficiency factor YidD [Anaerolineae bacterium]